MTMPHQRTEARSTDIFYPESDGRPIGETETHLIELIRRLLALREHHANRADVHAGGDLLLYYVECDATKVVVPDVFVAVGTPKQPPRRIYKLWEERVPLAFVIEITSPSSRLTDPVEKRELYACLGVAEYVLYDPLNECLRPALRGNRLVGGAGEPMAQDADSALLSDALDLRLQLMDGRLHLSGRSTGERLLSPEERAVEAAAARHAEAGARHAAEARSAELEARLRQRDAE